MMDETECSGGDELAVDWIEGLVLHRYDADWHPWDPTIYGEAENK